MLNINRKLVFLTMCGALLGAASAASQASNVYNVAPNQTADAATTEPHLYWACPTEYWACPTEPVTKVAKADQGTRTDAVVTEMPEHTWSLQDWSRYYDYSPFTLGD